MSAMEYFACRGGGEQIMFLSPRYQVVENVELVLAVCRIVAPLDGIHEVDAEWRIVVLVHPIFIITVKANLTGYSGSFSLLTVKYVFEG